MVRCILNSSYQYDGLNIVDRSIEVFRSLLARYLAKLTLGVVLKMQTLTGVSEFL